MQVSDVINNKFDKYYCLNDYFLCYWLVCNFSFISQVFKYYNLYFRVLFVTIIMYKLRNNFESIKSLLSMIVSK